MRRSIGKASVALLMGLPLIYGCTGTYTKNFSYSTNNSRTDSYHRRIVNNTNGEERSLETNDNVGFKDGKIVSFPSGTVIQLREQKHGRTTLAELRESNGALILWLKDNEEFRKGDDRSNLWLKEFLSKLNLNDQQPNEYTKLPEQESSN